MQKWRVSFVFLTFRKHMYIIGLKQSSVAYEFFSYSEETIKEWI